MLLIIGGQGRRRAGLWPILRRMVDARDFHNVIPDSIQDDVRQAWKHEFALSLNSRGAASARKIS